MKEQKDSSTSSEQASLGQTILQKLSAIEELLKKRDDKPLTFKEACNYLGYAPSYLYKLTYKNLVPHYKPTGKIIFFSKNELDEWIFKSRIRPNDGGQAQNSAVSSRNNETDIANVKDQNQIEMDLIGASTGSAQVKEILIEFPLKSRRNK